MNLHIMVAVNEYTCKSLICRIATLVSVLTIHTYHIRGHPPTEAASLQWYYSRALIACN